MFSYLSIITIMFFLIQIGFFINHLFFHFFTFVDLLPFLIMIFVIANIISNLRSFNKPESQTMKDLILGKWHSIENKRNYIMLLIVIPFFVILRIYIFAILPWFGSVDPFLAFFFFILSISFYWASSVEYSRFIINYEREIVFHKDELGKYIEKNCESIRKTIERYC